jgi:serine/threonine-protein kinase
VSWSSAAALACETAERDAHLEQSCADPAVKAEITSLLILADDHYRRRLRQEARAAATLSHPAIATVYALEEFDGALYLVCEYVTGTTLREALQDGPLPTATVRQAGTDIASALAAAHVRDLVHRNLKPENMMLTPEGSIHILDFGLAQFRRSSVCSRPNRRHRARSMHTQRAFSRS